jgi:hypothetical protein
MDNSPKALEICRLRGILNTILCDVEHFYRLDKSLIFDHIIFWGNNLGLFQSRDFFIYLMSVLENYTHDNSLLYLESMSPYSEGFLDQDTVDYVNQNLIQKKLGGQMHLRVRYKKFVTPWTDYLFLSVDELKTLLSKTNWSLNNIYADNESNQYIAVLKKNEIISDL